MRTWKRLSISLAIWFPLGTPLEAQERTFQEPLQVLVRAAPAQLLSRPGSPENSAPSPFSVQPLETAPPGAGQARLLRRWRRSPETEFVWMIQTPSRPAGRATSTLAIVP